MQEAEAKLNASGGIFGAIFGNNQKYEDAGDIYKRAANAFKVAKDWDMAGQCFLRCLDCSKKSGAAQFEHASLAKDAADCFKNVNSAEAIQWYRTSITTYCDMGRFNTAAKMQMEVAQLCESEDDKGEAIINYQQAADFFSAENQKSHATKALLKVGELSAFEGSYDKAIEIYESVAATCLESNLLKSNAKKHFLNAGFFSYQSVHVHLLKQLIVFADRILHIMHH